MTFVSPITPLRFYILCLPIVLSSYSYTLPLSMNAATIPSEPMLTRRFSSCLIRHHQPRASSATAHDTLLGQLPQVARSRAIPRGPPSARRARHRHAAQPRYPHRDRLSLCARAERDRCGVAPARRDARAARIRGARGVAGADVHDDDERDGARVLYGGVPGPAAAAREPWGDEDCAGDAHGSAGVVPHGVGAVGVWDIAVLQFCFWNMFYSCISFFRAVILYLPTFNI